jgi:excisionase family DNA binding protein
MATKDLITTGQAARILGVTRQHVIDLCERGELPYTMAGTHRRIPLDAVNALRDRPSGSRGGPMTKDQVRSLWLHRAAAGKIAADPSGSLAKGLTSVERQLAAGAEGVVWLRRWLDLIARGPEAVMRVMTSTDPEARELRQNSPWLGLLSDSEREKIVRSAFEATGGARDSP